MLRPQECHQHEADKEARRAERECRGRPRGCEYSAGTVAADDAAEGHLERAEGDRFGHQRPVHQARQQHLGRHDPDRVNDAVGKGQHQGDRKRQPPKGGDQHRSDHRREPSRLAEEE